MRNESQHRSGALAAALVNQLLEVEEKKGLTRFEVLVATGSSLKTMAEDLPHEQRAQVARALLAIVDDLCIELSQRFSYHRHMATASASLP